MMQLIKFVYKTNHSKKKCEKCDKKFKNLRTGSNNKTIPKTIGLAFRYNEAPVAP